MVRMQTIVARITFSCLIACVLALAACGDSSDQAAQTDSAAEAPATANASDVTSSDKKRYMIFADFVSETDSLPRLKYRDDGQVTLNDRCAVRMVRLNPKMQAAYVNGRPVGFC